MTRFHRSPRLVKTAAAALLEPNRANIASFTLPIITVVEVRTSVSKPLPAPNPSRWRCCNCGTRYRLGVTKRCIHDGHRFCLGTMYKRVQRTGRVGSSRNRSLRSTSTRTPPLPGKYAPVSPSPSNEADGVIEREVEKRQAEHRSRKIRKEERKTCSVTFDTDSWEEWNLWRAGQHVCRATPHSSPSSPFPVEIGPDCTRDCDFPGECRQREGTPPPPVEQRAAEAAMGAAVEEGQFRVERERLLTSEERVRGGQRRREEHERERAGEDQFQTWMRKWGLGYDSCVGCTDEEWLERSERATAAWKEGPAEMEEGDGVEEL